MTWPKVLIYSVVVLLLLAFAFPAFYYRHALMNATEQCVCSCLTAAGTPLCRNTGSMCDTRYIYPDDAAACSADNGVSCVDVPQTGKYGRLAGCHMEFL